MKELKSTTLPLRRPWWTYWTQCFKALPISARMDNRHVSTLVQVTTNLAVLPVLYDMWSRPAHRRPACLPHSFSRACARELRRSRTRRTQDMQEAWSAGSILTFLLEFTSQMTLDECSLACLMQHHKSAMPLHIEVHSSIAPTGTTVTDEDELEVGYLFSHVGVCMYVYCVVVLFRVSTWLDQSWTARNYEARNEKLETAHPQVE